MAAGPVHLRGLHVTVGGPSALDVEHSPANGPSSPKKAGTGPERHLHEKARRQWQCQVALALTQTAFVVGTVYLKSCLRLVDAEKGEVFHPLIYALAREVVAAPILLALAWGTAGTLAPKRPDLWLVFQLGVCLYLNQLLYINGIALSGVVVATCIQPTIPVFTAALAVMLKMEAGSTQKFLGIALAVGGSISMVFGGVSSQGHSATPGSMQQMLIGNACLLGNTLSTSFYYLTAKKLTGRYPSIALTAWAYVAAAAMMGVTAAATVEQRHWVVPRQLWGPLVYWIVVCSVIGYWVVTLATGYLPASQVAAFQCLQPFVGTALALAVLGEEPSWWDLGALGVIGGLALVTTDRTDYMNSALQPAIAGLRRIMSHPSLKSWHGSGAQAGGKPGKPGDE